jgi:hypothetical protein
MSRLLVGVAVSFASSFFAAGCSSCGDSKPKPEPTAEAPAVHPSLGPIPRKMFRIHVDGGKRHNRHDADGGAPAEQDPPPPQ